MRRAFLVAVHDQIAAIVERRKIGDRAQHDLQPMPREVHLADDLRVQQTDGITRHRIAEAGMKLFGDGSTADDGPPLQHTDIVTGPGEIKGASQPVMAAADQNGIVGMSRTHVGTGITNPAKALRIAPDVQRAWCALGTIRAIRRLRPAA